jgi:phosphoribosylaminoimidazole-succinocarboxamide synthase
MKHLRKFNESLDSTKEEILENFLFITDKFGEPIIQSSKYGEHKKWILSWNININFSALQNAEELIKKLKDITEDIDDVLAATDRLEDFDCNMYFK